MKTKQLINKLNDTLESLYIYQWCKDNSVQAHIVLSVILSLSYSALYSYGWFIALPISFIFCSMFYFGKEYFDEYRPNGTGFDWADIEVDYVSYAISVFTQTLTWIVINNAILK